jgi:hypothetical protein
MAVLRIFRRIEMEAIAMRNRVIAMALAAISTIGAVGCAVEEYRDRGGHPYHHRHWRNEEVYQREDGRWYARRHNDWVVVEVDR